MAAANVGGIVHSPALAGYAPDSASIDSVDIRISCSPESCTFRTRYHCTDSGKVFSGFFYGDRVTHVISNDSLPAGDLEGDSILAGVIKRRFGYFLDGFSNRFSLKRTPLRARVGGDSIFTVSGTLHSEWSEGWGLAALPKPAFFRHCLTAPQNIPSRKKAIYLIAPIRGFTALRKVHLRAEGIGTGLVQCHTDNDWIDLRFRTALDTVFPDSAPKALSLVYEVPGRNRYFHPALGGPNAYLGSLDGGFAGELGWEVPLTVGDYFALLPSVNGSFTRKHSSFWNLGLRGTFMSILSMGVQWRPERDEWVPVAGFDSYLMGVELRTDGVLFHIGM